MAIPGLVVCLFLIAILLVRDSRRRHTLSWAIWIPTIFLLIVGSRPLSFWFGGSRSLNGAGLANDVEGSPVDQIFFFSTIAVSFIITTMRQFKWGKFFATNLPLMLFYLYFAISIAWSEDPLGSSKRLFKDFGMLFVIALLLSEKDPLEAIRAVYVRCACVLFPLSVVCIKWFPGVARSFSLDGGIMYTGVTSQKNTLGEIVLIFSLFIIYDYLETRPAQRKWIKFPWEPALLLLMGFWLLEMCQSKTSLVCLLMGTALLVRKGWFASKTFSRAVLFAALSLPYILFFAQRFSSVIEPVVELVGRNMTFTGRTDIWQHIDSTTVNPLIGFGYYNFWGGTGGQNVNRMMHSTIPNAHDGYVDIYLDGGIIGLILLAYWLIAYGSRFVGSLSGDRFQRLRFSVLIVAIVYNISESNWARLSTIWFTTLLVLVYSPSVKGRLQKKRAPSSPEQEPMPLSMSTSPALERTQIYSLATIAPQ
jgi:exopolysaccharide production protein ExoQ